MRYVSVCSGVEAASVAWHDLGWTPVAFSEIEPFPSAVLKHRFPDVPNLGDMTKYKEWPIEPGAVDVLVGGTPCQSFSVAGLRKGLEDPRGNLMLVYLGLAEHLRVPWLVWENVPGVLSSSGGRDFGTFLGALGQLGYRWSYRTLDAQYFGVPQRRRRVFVVASLGDRPHPAKVLFEPESLRGDTAKGGKARKGSPRGARPSAESGGRIDCTSAGITDTVSSKWHKGTGGPAGDEHYNLVTTEAVGTLCSDTHPGAYSGQDAYTGRLVPQAVTATGPVTHALTVSDGATEDGTGRGTPIVPVSMRESGPGYWMEDTVSGTIDASMGKSGHGNRAATIAFHPTQDPISSTGATHALGTGTKGGCATVAVAIPIISDADRAESSAQTPSPDAEGRVRLRDPGLGIGNAGDPMYTLQASAQHAVAVAMAVEPYTLAIRGREGGASLEYRQDGTANTILTPSGGRAGIGVGAIAFAQNTRDEVRLVGGDGQTVGALAAQPDIKQTTYLATVTGTLSSRSSAGGGLGTDFEVAGGLQPTPTMAVRRLLPVECERLQGFPDNWTLIPWKKKPAGECPDGPRYKAMGNSFAVPVVRWIGTRLDALVKGAL